MSIKSINRQHTLAIKNLLKEFRKVLNENGLDKEWLANGVFYWLNEQERKLVYRRKPKKNTGPL